MKQTHLRAVATSAALLALTGCVVPPQGGYAAPAPYYPPPQAGYVAPPPPPDYTTDQYVYTDGTPYAVVGGQQFVVLFDPGLGWGYYDGYHRWHGAPGRWRDDFERRYPGGHGYAPSGRREEMRPPPGGPRGYPAAGRPEGPPPGRPGGFQPPPGRAPAERVNAPAPQREARPRCGGPGESRC